MWLTVCAVFVFDRRARFCFVFISFFFFFHSSVSHCRSFGFSAVIARSFARPAAVVQHSVFHCMKPERICVRTRPRRWRITNYDFASGNARQFLRSSCVCICERTFLNVIYSNSNQNKNKNSTLNSPETWMQKKELTRFEYIQFKCPMRRNENEKSKN